MDKRKEIIEYALIIALYYVTGGAFSYKNYSAQIIVFFCIGAVLCYLYGNKHYLLLKRVFTPWMLMSLFVFFVPLINDDTITTYIAIIMQLTIGLFCATIIKPDKFREKYTNIITIFAAISLIFFSIGMIAPSFSQHFPIIDGEASVDYYNAFVYVFMKAKGYSSLVLMNRNPGICWEPGCYQMFLNVGLLFLLEQEKKIHQSFFLQKMTILMVTIITTMSLTGILLLIVTLVTNGKVILNYNKKILLYIPVIIGIVYKCI